ncbi:MAG: hypothetical protein KDK36_16815 [Leptospiraceae bacterium]|nr:hypothetical protein [Leptospiraceae bacterium]
MKFYSILIILNIIFIFSVQADDICTAQKPNPIIKSVQLSKLKNYKIIEKPISKKNLGYYLTESFSLLNGQVVKIEQGGCAHFTSKYIFKLNEKLEKKPFDVSKWIAKTKFLINQMIENGVNLFGIEQLEKMSKSKSKLSIVESEKLDIEFRDDNGFKINKIEVKQLKNNMIELIYFESYAL